MASDDEKGRMLAKDNDQHNAVEDQVRRERGELRSILRCQMREREREKRALSFAHFLRISCDFFFSAIPIRRGGGKGNKGVR